MMVQSHNRAPLPLEGEEFRIIPGTSGRYEVSNLGRVRSLYRGDNLRVRPLVMKPLKGGFRGPTWRLPIEGRLCSVGLDRLLEAVEEDRLPQVGHRRGSDHHASLFGENEINSLRQEWEAKGRRRGAFSEIARAQGVNPATIRGLINGRTWRHVPTTVET